MKNIARISVHCTLILLLHSHLASAQKPELVTQINHTGWIQSVAFNYDGKVLATGGGDGTIKIWDVATGRQVRTIEGHSGIKIEPDEKPNFASSKDPVVYLFEQIRAGGWARVVNSIAFSPDGKTLASGSSDQTIKIWDFRTGELKATFNQPSRVWFVAFNHDGSQLISITEDDQYGYWDVINKTQITKDLQ
jgi:WD40 repeat protein